MVRTMSESMMRRVAGRCGAHRLQAPSGARFHGSTVPRFHGFTGSRVPGMGKALRRERLAKGLGVHTPSGARDSESFMPLSGM